MGSFYGLGLASPLEPGDKYVRARNLLANIAKISGSVEVYLVVLNPLSVSKTVVYSRVYFFLLEAVEVYLVVHVLL